MNKDRWEKIQILGKLIAGILIPAAILVASLVIAKNETHITELNNEARRLTSLVGPLSSENPKERLIAVEIADHLAKKGQLPIELTPTLLRIARTDLNSEVALAATTAAISLAEASPDVADTVKDQFATIPPRVYFHIQEESDRANANEIEQKLEEHLQQLSLVVPGIELMRAGPGSTELRFFRSNEREEAEQISDALKSIGVNVRLVDLSAMNLSTTDIRPRHYELWFVKSGT